MKTDTYSLRDLAEITGAKPRSIQLWASGGVILALPSTEMRGTGVHRQFSRDEAIVACIVHAFALRQISIGELKQIADSVRSFLLLETNMGVFDRAIGGKGNTILTYETWTEKGNRKHRCGLSQGASQKIFPLHLNNAESLLMAVRLETYLAKLA